LQLFITMNFTLAAISSLLLSGSAFAAEDERGCAMQDDDLLECPVVAAPLVTELKEGYVVLAFTVQPDGSVSDVQLVDSGGDKRWIRAAVDAVSRWKYRATDQPSEKTRRFIFQLGGSD
jgi:TonB family protein